MFSERGFISPDIEMLGRLIQERYSIVVGKRGRRMPTLFCVNRESVGVPVDAVADRSLRFTTLCNALRKTFSVWTKLLVCRYACTRVHML